MDDLVAESLPPWRRLDPRYVAMERQAALIQLLAAVAVLCAIGTFAWWLELWPIDLTVRIGAVMLTIATTYCAFSLILPAHRYRHSAWRFSAQGLEIRSGAWWRSETRVPLSRVQHTDVSQGPLERRHGLGTLTVYTAGTHMSAVGIDGIAHEDALALRDELLGADAIDSV